MQQSTIKIAVIGAGNMGSAIIKGLAGSNQQTFSFDIHVSDVNQLALDALQLAVPNITTATSNEIITKDADIIILAVKPWLVEEVAKAISHKIDYRKQIIVSIAAGIDLKTLVSFFGDLAVLFRIIPNTAIEMKQSVSIISSHQANESQQQLVSSIFSLLGKVFLVPESQLNALMSLSSCGIAYALQYIRAAMKGGVEMGVSPRLAKEVVIQTLQGAISLLETKDSHPEVEIDKVTTPGGITIKGLNEMEANGFTNAVIKGLKASHIR
ncbi:MAG TPA: pyrroline-5-carboxylate reductase [Paludibacter sp.]|nr:pyrroline-5-carboxylate reductase [Paludibacter sp.]